jgi:hypothetical protein
MMPWFDREVDAKSAHIRLLWIAKFVAGLGLNRTSGGARRAQQGAVVVVEWTRRESHVGFPFLTAQNADDDVE